MSSIDLNDNNFGYEPALERKRILRRAYEISPFRSIRVPLATAIYAVGLLMFLAIEPTKPWMLLVVAVIVTLAADGIIRDHPHGDFKGDATSTTPFLFLPALLTLGSGLFLEDVASGYWAVPGTVVAAFLMAAVLYADYLSVDHTNPNYPSARFVLTVGTYLTGFSFYAVVYSFDVDLFPAALAVGLVSMLLSVEVLREAEADPVRALVYAGVVGLIVAEVRWGLYFLPLESYLAAALLLLAFYLASGLVQHHLTGDLQGPVMVEFAVIGIIGIAIVILGRAIESGSTF